MSSWLNYLRQGLARKRIDDSLAGGPAREDLWTDLRNLRPFAARHWRTGALGSLIVVAGVLLSFPPPLIMRFLVDEVMLARRAEFLLGGVALLAAVKLLGMLLSSSQQMYFARFEQDVVRDVQEALLDRTLRFPKSFFDDKEVGYLMSRLLSDVQGLRWFLSGTLVYVVSNALRFAGGVVLLVYLEWRLALIALIVLPGLALGVRYFAGKLRVLSRHGMEQQASVSRSVQESLSSSALIKAFASERRTVDHMMGEIRASQQISLEQTAVSSLANLVIGMMPDVAGALVLLAGAYLVIRGEWTLGSLLAFQGYMGYVFSPAQFLATANLQLQSARTSLERVSKLFDIVPEENLGTGRPAERLTGAVDFRNVTFSYDAREPVVQDVSFAVRPGEHVAIVGPSGVGKTTLVSLLLRFYKPTQGEIWFDGRPASEYELGSLRRRIGYVPQAGSLVAGTIKENLRYGNPDAGEEQVMAAARVAGIHDFIAGLPDGYAAHVGERGVNLSEGQKQRIAIARALIKDPDILVLDEPTSALDSLTEKSIFEALPALLREKTLFVVAHRLRTIQNADRVLLLNEKRLVAMGTHQELVAGNEYYRSLAANQQVIIQE